MRTHEPPFPVFYLTHVMDRGGGAEEIAAHVVRGLDRNLFRPIVGCLWWGGSYTREFEAEGIEVFIVGQKDIGKWRGVRKMADFLKANDVAIAQTNMFMSNTWGRIAALIARVPVIVASEQLVREFDHPRKHFVPDLVLSWFTDRIIAVSQKVKDSYVKGGRIQPSKIEVIYNGIDIERFIPREKDPSLRRQLCPDSDGPIIGVVARLSKQKGHVYLLEAAREIIREFPGVRFLLFGDGPLRSMIEDRAQQLGVHDHVIFAGIHHGMWNIYPQLDISVLPSLAEGFSVTLIESMACGLPLVVTDVGGNREAVVDGESGFVVPKQDPKRLAEKILFLLRNPGRMKEMGSAARKRVEDRGFSLTQMVKNTEDLYLRLLREKGIG